MPGDRCGSVNPTRSKVRQGAFEGGPPEHPGRPQEGGGNVVPRWMVAVAVGETRRRYRIRLTVRLVHQHLPQHAHYPVSTGPAAGHYPVSTGPGRWSGRVSAQEPLKITSFAPK